jgi:RHS repeat-associated protein
MTDGTVTSVTSASYEPVTGHIKTITGPGAQSLTYTFDGHHIVGVAWAGPVSGAVTRTYDSGFRLATESVNDTSQVTYAYDADDLLVGVGDLTIQRDAASGLPTGASLGVLSETIGHNGFAELIEQTVTANGAPLYNVSYALDPLGRVSQKTETVDGVTTVFVYGYDAVGRLTSLTRDGASLESYSYDSNGNRATATVAGTSVTPTHDDQDRLLRYGNVQYTYNGSGQLATRTDGVQTTTYDYDAIGNLLGVSLPNGTAIAYLLDGLDRRVGKKINGAVVQRLLYAGDRPIAELDDQGAILSRFVYAGSDLAPIVIVKNGVAHRVITDQIGSVRLVVNTTTGTIVQRMDYDGFGNVLGDTNPGFQPFGFAGGLYDRDTGLVRFGARDYDPAIGRWTARDPIWFEGGDSNLYVYAHNDPINGNDPTGASVPVDVAAAIVNSFVLTPYLQFQLWVYTGGLGPLILDGLLPFLGIDPVQTLSDFFGLGVDTQSTAYVATDICIGVAEVAAGGAGAAKAARAAAEAQKAAELAKALEARRLAQAAEQAGKQVFKGEIAARTQAAKLAEKASADNRKAADELLRRTEREGWRTHPGGGRGGGRY